MQQLLRLPVSQRALNALLTPFYFLFQSKKMLLRLAMLVMSVGIMSGVMGQATVETDQYDYSPGSTAIITGFGFQPGEYVELHVHHAEGDPFGSDPQYHQPWYVTADAQGKFSTSWYVPTETEGDALGATLSLEAHGNMGSKAEWTFTDGPNDPYYSASITPSVATLVGSFTYSITISNLSGGPQSGVIASVRVAIPSGAGTPSSISVTATDPGSVSRTWGLTSQTGTLLEFKNTVTGLGAADHDIDPGGTIVITFTTTATTTGSKVWTTTAYKGNNFNNAGLISVSQPTVAIDKATPVVTPTVGTYIFNGSAQGPNTATNTGTGTSYTFSYSGTSNAGVSYGPSATAPVNAGSYTVTATVAASADGNYNSASSSATAFTIGKAPSVTTVTIAASPHIYTGSAITPASVTVTGASGLNLTPDPVYANNINAGTANASYTYAGDANHEGSSDSKNFTINKANAVITVNPYTVTYDGTPHTSTFTAVGVESPTPVDLSALMDVSGTTHTNAGTYNGDAWSFAGNDNYNAANGTVNNKINKANAVITVNPYTVTYDGTPHTSTFTAVGVESPTPVDLSALMDVSGTTHTNAGTYNGDAWSFAGNDNYNAANGTVNNKINKAPTSISITFGNLVYDGNPKVATATVIGVGGLNQSLTVTYVGTGSTTYGPSITAPTLAGTYSASASFTQTDNHLASSKTENFTILAAGTTTTLTLSAASVRYMDNVTMTAVIVPANTGSPLTGTVTFKINGVTYGSAAVVPIPGASNGAVQAQLIKQVAEMPNVPNTATYPVVAEFVSTNANYSGRTDTRQLNVRPRNAEPFTATGFYTGDLFAWTTGPSTSTATVTMAAVLKDIDMPKGDLRGARVTFYMVNGTTLTPISSAQNLPVGLIDAADGSVGAASAIVQLNIGSQNATSFHIAVGVTGAYSNNPWDALSQCIVTVSKPITGGFIVGGGKVMNNNTAGLIKGHTGLHTDYEFDIQYTKSGTNPKGKAHILVRSYYDRNGLLDSKLHTYHIRSSAISLLNVGAPNATGTFSSKANLDEQLDDGTIVAIEGGATFQMVAFQNGCTQQIAITFYRKAGGIWFSSNWNATQTKTDLQSVTTDPKSCVRVSGGGSCASGTNSKTISTLPANITIGKIAITESKDIFNVKVLGNPSLTSFRLQLSSNDQQQKITVKVVDVNGRVIEVKQNLYAGQVIELGNNYKQGTYFAEVMQGTNRKVVKLLKVATE